MTFYGTIGFCYTFVFILEQYSWQCSESDILGSLRAGFIIFTARPGSRYCRIRFNTMPFSPVIRRFDSECADMMNSV